jgi:hypothetical protein
METARRSLRQRSGWHSVPLLEEGVGDPVGELKIL